MSLQQCADNIMYCLLSCLMSFFFWKNNSYEKAEENSNRGWPSMFSDDDS